MDEYAGSRVALVAALAEVKAHLNLQELRLTVPWQDLDLLQLLQEQGITGDHVPLPWHTMRFVNFPLSKIIPALFPLPSFLPGLNYR